LYNHQLSNDSSLNREIVELAGHVFSTKCRVQRKCFDSVYLVANYSIIRQDYLLADEQLAYAIGISEKYPECNIDASAAMTDKKLYLKNTSYQKLMQKATVAFAAKNYPDYFYYYSEAETFYQLNQINNTGLVHSRLIDLVTVSADTTFILRSFDYLTLKNKLEDALLCLKTLEKLNIGSVSTKGIQQQLGVKMAMRDHLQNFTNNPVLMSINYTANSKWLRYFKAAYVRTWRSMR
jgi:hypothetical protein